MIIILSSPLYFPEALSENSKIKDEKTKTNNRFIEDEYIIKLKDWGDENSRSQMFDHDAEIQKKNEKMKTIKVKILEKNREKFLEKIRKRQDIVWVEPNYIIEVEMTPNDPSWGQQWGPQKISANEAWNLEQGNQDVLVVIIDTGVYYNHPDLASNYVSGGYDWVNDDPDPIDDHGHGTHCAGIVAATINNAKGIAGLAQVKIMAEKFLGSTGYGSSWDAAQAIIHAIDIGKTISDRIILSNSWGSSGSSNTVQEAMEYAYQNGALITAAAGNDASNAPFYPASYPEVVSVSATDSNDNLASFSNYGKNIEISAPGVSIYSTYLDNNYKSMSGTSMATPHVSGVAALIWSRFSDYNRDLIRILLQNAADDLGQAGWDQYYGYGRLNAFNAMQGSPSHDIRVTKVIESPMIFPNQLAKIECIIQNIGTNIESNITVQFIVDDTIISSKNIIEIQSGETVYLEFDWTPTHIGTYNITFYALPIIEENSIQNNHLSQQASVQESGNILVVSDDDGSYYSNIGTSKNQIISALTKYGYEFNVWIESEYGRPSLNTLTQFRVVIWTCGDYWHWAVDPTDADNLIQYVNGGGAIILEGGDIGFDHFNDELMENIAHAIYQVDSVGSNGLTVLDPYHPICKDIPNSFGWQMSPGWEDGVIPNNNGIEIMKYTDTSYSAVIAFGNGGAKSTIYLSFPLACLKENIREKILINSLEWLQQNSYTVKIETKNLEFTGSKCYINKIAYNLPDSITLPEGFHHFAVYPTCTNTSTQYVFSHWENENGQVISDNLFFSEDITDNRTFYACFKEYPPKCLDIIVSEIENVTVGQEIELNVTVHNNGSCPINEMLIKLILSTNVTLMYDESEQLSISSIAPGESLDLSWHIVPNQPGLLRLFVTANGKDLNQEPAVHILRMSKDVSE
jgi:thermitase